MIKLLKFLKPHRKFAVFTLLLAAVNNILTLAFPLLMSQLINNGITQGNLENIKSVGGILLLVCVVAAIISVFNCYCSSKVSTSLAG